MVNLSKTFGLFRHLYSTVRKLSQSVTGRRKGKLIILILVLLAIIFFTLPAQAQYGGGTGESNDPYLIYTAEQMNAIGANRSDWNKHFRLMADIDMSSFTGTGFNIIGSYVSWDSPDNEPFSGVFDGSGHKISNFGYASTSDPNNVGLFGYVGGGSAQIKDLGLIDPNVSAGAGDYVAALVGLLNGGIVSNCYAKDTSISGTGWGVGGLVGANWGTITNCYSSGSVSGTADVGGLVGHSFDTITNCYSAASVSGGYTVGGLVGMNYSTISNSYATGDVQADQYVGGLVGWNNFGTITYCYSSGSVTGTNNAGGLVGSSEMGTISACLWDADTSGQSTSAGGTGKTTAEMKTKSTFTGIGWDFVAESINGTEDIWSICEGTNYPRLRRLIPACDFVCPDGIDKDDFSFFLSHWLDSNCDLSNNYCDGTDLNKSGTVDNEDLEIFIANWQASIGN